MPAFRRAIGRTISGIEVNGNARYNTTHEPQGHRHHPHRHSRPGTGGTKSTERKGSNLAERSQKSCTFFRRCRISDMPTRAWGMRKIEMMISTARAAEDFRSPTASPLKHRLVKGIGDRGSQWTRQNEKRPRIGSVRETPHRMLATPFVTHLANRLGAVPAPEPPTGSLKRQERRLANGGAVGTDRHQCCHRAAVTRDDRRPALLAAAKRSGSSLRASSAPLRCIASNLHSPALREMFSAVQ